MSINCLIVEDEPLAAAVVQDYINQVPHLKLIESCADALLAMECLQKNRIDLIFLDINLPVVSGLDFIKTMPNPPNVILTTAYREFALNAFDLNVVDYLVKPIEFERFLTAIGKINANETSSNLKTSITIVTNNKKTIVPIEEIIYIESQKEYIEIYTTSKVYKTLYSISKIEEELPADTFLRVHRSFIVSIPKIRAFNKHEIELADKSIAIGRSYSDVVEIKLNKLFV